MIRSKAPLKTAAFCIPLLVLTASSAARAASTEACLAAYERSQELRLDGKFEASREQLSQCVDESCPGLVRKDCSQWLGELDAAMPTIIFNARDAEGKDLVSARVRVDGNVMLEKLDGKPHPIDPGVHVFRYDLEGFEPSEETVVIQEAEKNRVLLAKLRRVPVASFVDPPRHDVAAGVLVGVGAVGVAGFAYLALSGLHDRDDLAARCAPHCPEGEVDAARTKIVFADLSLGLGLASLAGAAYLYFSPQKSATALQLGARPIAGGAQTDLRFSF